MEIRVFNPVPHAVRAYETIDRYTSPRRNTAGNFDKPNLFQAVVDGATEGFYLMDLPGVCIQGGAGATAALARRYLYDHPLVGVLTGTTTGAAVAVATSMATGGSPTALVTLGALLGAYSGMRGDSRSAVRDAGVNGLLLASPFIAGPSKVVGGLGSIIGAHFQKESHRALVGLISGATIGVSLSLAGVLPLDPLKAGLVCGGTGATGSILGPRLNQFSRNLAEDIGEKGRALTGKPREEDSAGESRWARTLGVVPLSLGKEMVMATLYGDGAWMKGLAGGVVDSLVQGNIMYHSKVEKHLAPDGSKA